jgi:hypothetical protein
MLKLRAEGRELKKVLLSAFSSLLSALCFVYFSVTIPCGNFMEV